MFICAITQTHPLPVRPAVRFLIKTFWAFAFPFVILHSSCFQLVFIYQNWWLPKSFHRIIALDCVQSSSYPSNYRSVRQAIRAKHSVNLNEIKWLSSRHLQRSDRAILFGQHKCSYHIMQLAESSLAVTALSLSLSLSSNTSNGSLSCHSLNLSVAKVTGRVAKSCQCVRQSGAEVLKNPKSRIQKRRLISDFFLNLNSKTVWTVSCRIKKRVLK